MNFFKKFGELQILMLQHNAGLIASHPYASGPFNWPFLVSGISFWTQNDGQKQIYLTGNLLGWLACTFGVAIFVGILGADLLARRRGVDPIPTRTCLVLASVDTTDNAHSGTQPPLELDGLLPPRVGRALLPVLPHGQIGRAHV